MKKWVSTCLLLLISALAQANSNCDDTDLETVDKCKGIYDTLESALLTPENLYTLRQAFHQIAQHSPSVLHISYNLHQGNNITSVIDIGWTSHGFFTIMNPIALFVFQPRVILLLLKGLQLSPPPLVPLVLDVDNATFTNSSDLKLALEILTTRLKPYTTAQGKLSSWDGSGEGFTWDPTQQLWTLAIPILSLTLAVHSFIITLAPKIRDSLKKYSRNKAFGTLFWCLATTTFFANFYNYDAMWFDQLSYPFQRYPQAHAFRPIVDWLPLGLGILVGILPSVWISYNITPPYILFPPESKYCKCLKNSASCITITLSMYLTGMFIFVTYATVSIIPTFLLVFIYPLEVISTVVFLTTVIVSLPFILIPYIVLMGSLMVCDYSNCRKKACMLYYCLLLFCIILTVAWINLMYVQEIATSAHKFPQFLLTLFTSVVFATITYITKRVFLGSNVIDLINNEKQVESTTKYGATNSELQQLVVATSNDTEERRYSRLTSTT